jgi:tRNA threonylcarbamoyladenosine biosynthesis protein TsaE
MRIPLYTWRTHSARETERAGERLGERIHSGLVVSISGPLGAGKTVLVRGVCRGLGVVGEVLSPTFILMEMLQGRVPVAHVDLYRLENESELENIGVLDMPRDTVVLAEWGERSPQLAADADVSIRIHPGEGDTREIVVEATRAATQELEGPA